MKHLLLQIVLFFIASTAVVGQININEYSAANLYNIKDNHNKTEDWIELYNSQEIDVDISGYHLSDKASKPGKWTIPEGTIIPAHGYLVFWCSGRDESFRGHFHTNFKLAQTKGNETLIFSDPSEIVIDEIPLGIALTDHSYSKTEDGGDTWAVCTTPTPRASNNNVKTYQRYTVAPSMDKEAGFYIDEVLVTITNNEPNSTLRFTTNGDNPTENSPIYMIPIAVNNTTIVKATSFSEDTTILTGKMDFNTYFINENFTLAVFSVGADEVINLANGNGDLIPVGSIEYFTKDKVRDATSFGSLNRHGQDSWILDHRSIDWVSRDEMGYSKAVKAKLFSYSDRDEYQKFMFRNSGDDNYPANDDQSHEGSTHIRDEYVQTLAMEGGMKVDQRAVERVILFLNGEYWGVYGMRERPVDHDYTKEYYDQGKYDLQFLTTWGSTQAQYGGAKAFNDWYRLRDFIMMNDMSDSTNYDMVKDELNVLSLIDYMIVNLNSVASDWLNYNTGWWRGIDADGDHKKWGYILWDLDATFDYYINYSGVPNTDPDAVPCDIDEIANFVEGFFGEIGYGTQNAGGGHPIANPETCVTILNGSSPYPATDTIYTIVIEQDDHCCNTLWDKPCQDLYDEIGQSIGGGGGGSAANCPSVLNGTCPFPANDPNLILTMSFAENCCDEWGGFCNEIYDFFAAGGGGGGGTEVSGNVGMHAKIFQKLQNESPEFKQLYYSRQADLMNTVYSCENMISTLERMLAVIEPEMPRQIERWGGTMTEWQQNVDKLKSFINQRCELFDDGMTECFELTGPFEVTMMVQPEGVGEIKINTIDIETFPWKGDYFGGMINKLKAKSKHDDYVFSHWESKAGSEFAPSMMDRKSTVTLVTQDTIVAVFKNLTAVTDLESGITLNVFPNPTTNVLNVNYDLKESANIKVSLVSMLGQSIAEFPKFNGNKSAGNHSITIDIDRYTIPAGIYLLKLQSERFDVTRKVSIVD
ncbi:MAG: CotH kinase family protein [Saprospiraceae bacterium]